MGSRDVDLNFFTCTLGEAASRNLTHNNEYRTITEFIDYQAKHHEDEPAVGYPEKAIYSFSQMRNASLCIAQCINSSLSNQEIHQAIKEPTVGLICQSTLDLLFAWLALMRLGFKVLLIAPQCSPNDIVHLCRELRISDVYYDKKFECLVKASTDLSGARLRGKKLQWQRDWDSVVDYLSLQTRLGSNDHNSELPVFGYSTTAFYHHSSGTSGTSIKVIPQSHHGACGALPSFDGRGVATFSTTPLYHGGIADCFRSWTSASLIWIMPGEVKLTTNTILSAFYTGFVELTYKIDTYPLPHTNYFSCVPFIIETLCASEAGIRFLLDMNLVGVGGALLPEHLGNLLVGRGVKLVSRFGSSECGFLLSSHRDYELDKDWQYLRVPESASHLQFEKWDSNECSKELVILKGWPHMAKTNRDDGSLATSDLFQSHPRIKNAWKHVGRSDGMITLVTGKKFDPIPIEQAIEQSSPLIRDAFVFGNGRHFLGALIFKSEEGDPVETSKYKDLIWPGIQAWNEKVQDHMKIPGEMLIVVGTNAVLEKNSKGSIMRALADSRYLRVINRWYEGIAVAAIDLKDDDELLEHVKRRVAEIAATRVEADTDLSKLLDSIQATRIRMILQKDLIGARPSLPWTIVYDCGDVSTLAQAIIKARKGLISCDETQAIEDMFRKYAKQLKFATSPKASLDTQQRPTLTRTGAIYTPPPPPTIPRLRPIIGLQPTTVVLTGATGALGGHILHQLLTTSSDVVFCLVRAKSQKEAEERVFKNLSERQFECKPDQWRRRIMCLAAKLEEDDLGIGHQHFESLKKNVTCIIHAAWEVNFSRPLRHFEPQVHGLLNLINMSELCHYDVHLMFCSSTAAVANFGDGTEVFEKVYLNNSAHAGTLGYSQSKWVAEALCYHASNSSDARVTILRIGQLTADTEYGVWSKKEAWPLMLSTFASIGCLPQIDEELTWLPLDIAAKAIIQIKRKRPTNIVNPLLGVEKTPPLFHLVSTDTEAPTWNDMLQLLKEFTEEDGADDFEITDFETWREKLEDLADKHPAKALMGLWSEAEQAKHIDAKCMKFDVSMKTYGEAPILQSGCSVDKVLIRKIWDWIRGPLVESIRADLEKGESAV